MALTPAQKRAHDKYDQANYTNLAIRIRKTYADEIRQACKDDGIAPASIMRAAIDSYMKEYRARHASNGEQQADLQGQEDQTQQEDLQGDLQGEQEKQ